MTKFLQMNLFSYFTQSKLCNNTVLKITFFLRININEKKDEILPELWDESVFLIKQVGNNSFLTSSLFSLLSAIEIKIS